MVKWLKKAGGSIKGFMKDGIKECGKILLNAQNRLTLGLIILGAGVGIGIGLGGGLIVSAYVRVPE